LMLHQQSPAWDVVLFAWNPWMTRLHEWYTKMLANKIMVGWTRWWILTDGNQSFTGVHNHRRMRVGVFRTSAIHEPERYLLSLYGRPWLLFLERDSHWGMMRASLLLSLDSCGIHIGRTRKPSDAVAAAVTLTHTRTHTHIHTHK
jgi:hypothetical protein